MKDLYNHLVPIQAIKPVLVLDATVPAAVEVDLAGSNSALIIISCGAKVAGDTGTIDVALTHAADNGAGVAGDYSDVVLADVQGPTAALTTGIIKNLAGGAVTAGIYKVGYTGGKRFIKITVTETNANATGTILGITVLKGNGQDVPAIV